MKATKIAALVLSVLMAVGCCACSQKPGGASSGTSAPPSGAQSSGTESQIDLSAHRDIVMWMVSSPPSGLEDVLSAINEKLEADFNATLHYNLLGFDSEMMTKYGLLLAGNEQVDIIQGSSVFFSTYVSQGAYSALDDYLPTYAPDIWENQRKEAWNQASYNGKIYAIPSLMKMYSEYGIFYRKDLAKKYGFDEDIKDYETLEAYLEAIAQNESMLPFNISGEEASYMIRFLRAYCGFDQPAQTNQSVAFVSADQKDLTDVFFFAEREEFKDFAVMLKRWADKGFWSKSALSGSVFAKTQFANNQSAACINLMGDQEGTGMVSYLPSVEGAEAGFMDWPSMSGIFHYDDWMNDACAFPTNGDGDLGRTLMVYNALVTDEDYYMLAQYGFEGKNYVLDKDGYISLPDGVTDKTNTYSYGAAGLWPLRNSKYYHMSVNFDPATQDRHAYYDSIATENKLASFVLDTTEIQAEIAALEQANTQYLYPILYGQVKDVDEAIAAYVQAAKDAGCDRVVGEVKTQLEKYVSQYGY